LYFTKHKISQAILYEKEKRKQRLLDPAFGSFVVLLSQGLLGSSTSWDVFYRDKLALVDILIAVKLPFYD